MNGYVKKFQASKPQMHDLHADMIQLIQDFLALFLSSEKVPSTLSEFSNFNVSSYHQRKLLLVSLLTKVSRQLSKQTLFGLATSF